MLPVILKMTKELLAGVVKTDRIDGKNVEMRGIEPRAFHMQSERSTTELHPQMHLCDQN